MARAFMGVGRVGIAASLLFSICNVCFSTSVVYTDAANTLVIVASSTEGQFRFNSRTLLGALTSPPPMTEVEAPHQYPIFSRGRTLLWSVC